MAADEMCIHLLLDIDAGDALRQACEQLIADKPSRIGHIGGGVAFAIHDNLVTLVNGYTYPYRFCQ